jgi:hypothetical protein
MLVNTIVYRDLSSRNYSIVHIYLAGRTIVRATKHFVSMLRPGLKTSLLQVGFVLDQMALR